MVLHPTLGPPSRPGGTPCLQPLGVQHQLLPSQEFPDAFPCVPACIPSHGEPYFSPQPCLQYWPEPGLQQYGPMEVEYISGVADEDVVSRLFRVQNITRVSCFV